MVVVSGFEWALRHPDVVDIVCRSFVNNAGAAAFARDWAGSFISAVTALLLLLCRVWIGHFSVVGRNRCVDVFGAGE